MVALLQEAPTTTIRLHETGPKLAVDERRMFPRRPANAQARCKRVDHALPALRHPALTLSLRDLSLGGLSAISETPLQRGERLTVSFPAQGVFSVGSARRNGWDTAGRVIRCEPSGLGYRVAVEFDAVLAAA